MNCPNCGNITDDHNKFCPECGTQMTAINPEHKPEENAPRYDNLGETIANGYDNVGTNSVQAFDANDFGDNPLGGYVDVTTDNTVISAEPVYDVKSNIKKVVGGPCFLIMAIVATLNLIMTIVSDLVAISYVPFGMIGPAVVFLGIIIVITFLPALFDTIGFFKMYASARNPYSDISGGSLVNAASIIRTVFVGIALGIIVTVMLISNASSEIAREVFDIDYQSDVRLAINVTFTFAITILVLSMIYYIKWVHTVNVAVNTAKGFNRGESGSLFVVVVNFMLVALNIIFYVITFTAAYVVSEEMTFIAMLMPILSITNLIAMSIAIINIRGVIAQHHYHNRTHTY